MSTPSLEEGNPDMRTIHPARDTPHRTSPTGGAAPATRPTGPRRRPRWRTPARLALLALVATLAGLPSGPAGADPVGYTRATVSGDDLVYTVDLATGATILVGDTGLTPATRGLTFGPDGTLYGANRGDLVEIDTATGAATVVGAFGCCTIVEDMTFDAYGQLWLLSSNPSHLYRVDLDTGEATHVTGPVNGALLSGLAADCEGTLYAADTENDQLLAIDAAHPDQVTEVGPFGVDLGSASLDTDAGGTLWALARPSQVGASRTYTLDPTDGTATLVQATVTGNGPGDLALNPPDCGDVPLPTTSTTTSTTTRETTSTTSPTARETTSTTEVDPTSTVAPTAAPTTTVPPAVAPVATPVTATPVLTG